MLEVNDKQKRLTAITSLFKRLSDQSQVRLIQELEKQELLKEAKLLDSGTDKNDLDVNDIVAIVNQVRTQEYEG